MKKIIFILILAAISVGVKSQSDILIPVNRISYVSNDTGSNASLFNFNPSTLELKVISGGSAGNFNFFYSITDSIAYNSPHSTPFGAPFTRTSSIQGNISFPVSVFNACFNWSNTPPTPNILVLNQLLSSMDMIIDTTKSIIIQ